RLARGTYPDGCPGASTMYRIKRASSVAACLIAFLVASSASVGDDEKKDPKLKEPTPAQTKIAKKIAGGHAYEKHVIEERQFPEVKNESDFAGLIGKILAN